MHPQHAIAGFSYLVSASSDKRGKGTNLRWVRVLAANDPSFHQAPSGNEEEGAHSHWTLTRKPARVIPWRSAAVLRHLSMATSCAPRLVEQHHGVAEPINNTLLEP